MTTVEELLNKLNYRANCKLYSLQLDTFKLCKKSDCDYKSLFYGSGCACKYKMTLEEMKREAT